MHTAEAAAAPTAAPAAPGTFWLFYFENVWPHLAWPQVALSRNDISHCRTLAVQCRDVIHELHASVPQQAIPQTK